MNCPDWCQRPRPRHFQRELLPPALLTASSSADEDLNKIVSEAGITWAIPVDISLLGPVLEAYVDLYLIFMMLRLCRRTGKNAEVSRLPIEIIEEIEDILLQDRRATIEAAWKLDYRCWSRDCTPVEHLTREQFEQQQLKKFNDDASLCPHGAPSELSDDLLCNQIRGEMEESLGNEFETRIIHDLCAERWQWRAERLFTLDRDRHDVPQQVFRSVFGLQAMIGRITTNGLRCDSPSYGAFSYICLPSSFRTRTSASDYPIFSRDRSADIYATESGINPELLPRMKAKFVYAMHKLNLQPYQTLSWYSKDYPNEQGMNEAEPKTWPRHVILTRFTSHQAS